MFFEVSDKAYYLIADNFQFKVTPALRLKHSNRGGARSSVLSFTSPDALPLWETGMILFIYKLCKLCNYACQQPLLVLKKSHLNAFDRNDCIIYTPVASQIIRAPRNSVSQTCIFNSKVFRIYTSTTLLTVTSFRTLVKVFL